MQERPLTLLFVLACCSSLVAGRLVPLLGRDLDLDRDVLMEGRFANAPVQGTRGQLHEAADVAAGVSASRKPGPDDSGGEGILAVGALRGIGDLTDALTHNHSASEAVGVKKNSELDFEIVLKGLSFSVFGGLFCIALWLLLIRCFPAVYMFRTESDLEGYDAKLPVAESSGIRGLWEWFCAVNEVTDEEVIRVAGLDSFMLCEFHRVCRNILLVLIPLTVMVLGNLHFFLGRQTFRVNGTELEEIDFLGRIGIFALTSTWDDPEFLKDTRFWSKTLAWTHVGVSTYVVLLIVKEISNAQHRFLDFRFKWLSDMPHKRASTVLVERIPQTLRSDDALNKYFASIFSKEAIQRAYVVRKTSKLRSLMENVRAKSLALDVAQQAVATPPPEIPPSWWQSAYWRRQTTDEDVQRLSESLGKAQQALEADQKLVAQGVKDMDLNICSSSGFITFTSRRWSRLAAREQLRADAWQFTLSPAPEPGDVRYEDLERNPSVAVTNEVIAGLLTTLVFITWFPVTVFLTSLTSLDSLLKYKTMSWLVPLCAEYPALKVSLESFLATLVLQLFLAFLPSLLLAIIYRFLNLKGGRNAQLMMQGRYFAFLMVFVVLVSALSKTLIHTLEELLANPNHVFVMVGKLPNSSDFYISYLVLACFTLCVSSLRLSPLFWHLCSIWHGRSPREARAETEPEDQDSDGMGARMAVATIMMTIAIVYCSCSPLISLAALGYFTLGAWIYRWRVIYSETRKPDLGGDFWVLALKHLYVAVGLYIVLMSSLLFRGPFLHKLPAWAMATTSIPLFVGYVRFKHLSWEMVPCEDVAKADMDYRRMLTHRMTQGLMGDGESVGEYWQEECGLASLKGAPVDEECAGGASSSDQTPKIAV